MKFYMSPTAEIISLDIADIIASSPYKMEDITSSGNVIEWEWAN